MSEYERSLVIEAAPETVFNIVSSVLDSSILTPTAYQARTPSPALNPASPTRTWNRIHPGEYLVEWGSDGDQFYSGWLQIEELDENASEITMHLSLPSRLSADSEAVRQDLLTAMQAIKVQAELRAPSSATLPL